MTTDDLRDGNCYEVDVKQSIKGHRQDNQLSIAAGQVKEAAHNQFSCTR